MLGDLDREIYLLCPKMLWKLMPAADMVQVVWEVKGESDLLEPEVFSGVAEAIISGKFMVERSHPYNW